VALIVTADRVSVLTEAFATGRPVYFYDTGEAKTSMRVPPALPRSPDHRAEAGSCRRNVEMSVRVIHLGRVTRLSVTRHE